jgi:hypothetical protein
VAKSRIRWLVAIIGACLLLPAGCTAWLFLSLGDPAPFVATLDALPVPQTWEVVRTYTQRDFIMGTRADRYYFVDGDPQDAVPTLKNAMKAAGFEIYISVAASDWCDPHPLDSIVVPCATKVIEDCRENGLGGPISCRVEAFRRIAADPQHLEDLYASLSPRGTTVDYGPGASPRYLSDPNRAVVVISASLSYPRHFWSSPTPATTGD